MAGAVGSPQSRWSSGVSQLVGTEGKLESYILSPELLWWEQNSTCVFASNHTGPCCSSHVVTWPASCCLRVESMAEGAQHRGAGGGMDNEGPSKKPANPTY